MGMSRGGRFLFHLIAGGEDKRGDASRNFQVLGVPLLACRVRTEDTDRGNQGTEKEKWRHTSPPLPLGYKRTCSQAFKLLSYARAQTLLTPSCV